MRIAYYLLRKRCSHQRGYVHILNGWFVFCANTNNPQSLQLMKVINSMRRACWCSHRNLYYVRRWCFCLFGCRLVSSRLLFRPMCFTNEIRFDALKMIAVAKHDYFSSHLPSASYLILLIVLWSQKPSSCDRTQNHFIHSFINADARTFVCLLIACLLTRRAYTHRHALHAIGLSIERNEMNNG